EVANALGQLRVFDFSACRDKRFGETRDKDVASFERGSWFSFVKSGLATKALAAGALYYNKPIPSAAHRLYASLPQHAPAEIIRTLAEQTRATWEFLERFHGSLWSLKQTTGKLRFGEVTQAVVDALKSKALRPETLSFRLDGAVRHLLLDEFQDTALSQWR